MNLCFLGWQIIDDKHSANCQYNLNTFPSQRRFDLVTDQHHPQCSIGNPLCVVRIGFWSSRDNEVSISNRLNLSRQVKINRNFSDLSGRAFPTSAGKVRETTLHVTIYSQCYSNQAMYRVVMIRSTHSEGVVHAREPIKLRVQGVENS